MKKVVTLILTLILGIGCSNTEEYSFRYSNGHRYDYLSGHNGDDWYHSEFCNNVDHKKLDDSLAFEFVYKILALAPRGTSYLPLETDYLHTYAQNLVLESDTMNRYGKLTHYLCMRAIVPPSSTDRFAQKAWLRAELVPDSWRNGEAVLNGILHVHTCIVDTCRFLYTRDGWYNGCSCGDRVRILGLK